MQLLDQSLQNLLLQKQAFQMEFSESEAALNEIDSAGEEVFKIVGQLMIKTEKEKLKKELSEKKDVLNLRVKALEKQELSLTKKADDLREELMKSMKK